MGIFRSTDPTVWDDVDGIIINEVAPPSNVVGVPANIAVLVGQFQRGPEDVVTEVGSLGEIYEIFGNDISFGGQVAITNKRFGALKIVRVVAAAAVKGFKAFQSSAVDRITFTAKYYGAYGNSITVKIESGTTVGKKYTVHDGSANAVWPDEVYDDVLIAAVGSTFSGSKLISVVVNSTAAEPSNIAATALATGSDGTVADTDYLTAISAQEGEAVGNILFLDSYNTVRNGYLKTSMAATTDRMTVVCGAAGDSKATAIAAVASLRDTDGRLIYAFPYVKTTISGVSTLVNGASFYASLMSQIAPNIDPAWAGNVQYLAGINEIELVLTRNDYISLVAAGISSFENDADLGIKIKSGVTTQISNSGKVMIFRRRMADYITYSVAKFLKQFGNGINSEAKQVEATSAVVRFNRDMENVGLVPKDSEIKTGKASIVDGKSLNTDDSIARGFWKLLYKRRIYSSMRYIVLQAEIGESVVVTEQEST